jgi:hypothetical protein
LAAQEATAAQMRVEKTKQTIADLERQLRTERELLERDERELGAALKAEEDARVKLANAADSWAKSAERRLAVDVELGRASEHNRTIGAQEAQAKRRLEVAAEVEKLRKEKTDLTAVLEKIDARKAEILAAAKLPVEGLSIGDDGIELAGVPFVQASASERLRVALALAIAASPNLGEVWIRDGALLDDEALELVATNAAAAGKRVWVERVGTKDPGVIVIRDGAVIADA